MSNREKTKQTSRVSLTRPPIVTSRYDEQGAADFINYAFALEHLPNTDAAEQEGRRLTPMFTAIEKRVRKLARRAPEFIPPYLNEKGVVMKAFIVSAAATGSTVLSVPAIVPASTLWNLHGIKNEEGKQKKRFGGYQHYTPYTGAQYMMGFFQSHRTDENDKKISSISVPVIAFDTYTMDTIAKYQSKKLLGGIQNLCALMNHDPYHQFSNVIANPGISNRTNKVTYADQMYYYSGAAFDDNDDEDQVKGYEGWARASHIDNWKELWKGSWGRKFRKNLDLCFDELERISREYVASKTGKTWYGQDSTKEPYTHHAIDYFSTQLCYFVMAILPLDDPLMKHALKRAEQVDPMPENMLLYNMASQLWRIPDDFYINLPESDFDELLYQLQTCSPLGLEAAANTNKAIEEYSFLPSKETLTSPEDLKAHEEARIKIRKAFGRDIKKFWPHNYGEIPHETMRNFARYLATYRIPDERGDTVSLLEKTLPPLAAEVLNAYRQQGRLTFSPEDETTIPYAYLKPLQLMTMDPKFASIHAPLKDDEAFYRNRTAAIDAGFLSAILKPAPAGP
jgi:hypothetical protein